MFIELFACMQSGNTVIGNILIRMLSAPMILLRLYYIREWAENIGGNNKIISQHTNFRSVRKFQQEDRDFLAATNKLYGHCNQKRKTILSSSQF